MDPSSIAAVGTALGTLKSLIGIARDVGKIELQDKVFELQGQLLNIQQRIADLQDENFKLREENRILKQSTNIEAELSYDGYVYWRQLTDGLDGPFCPVCWDSGRKLIRLHYISGDFGEEGDPHTRLDCSVHKGSITEPYAKYRRHIQQVKRKYE